jgi:DNA polymerase
VDAVITVGDFTDFRREARLLLAASVRPDAVSWVALNGQHSLFDAVRHDAPSKERFSVPRRLASLLEEAACHCEPMRWSLLYRVLWRMTRGAEVNLIDNPADPDVHQLRAWAHAVAHEVHQMHAFVRFRRCSDGQTVQYVAWFEPRHRIVRRAAPFFVDRFAGMRWMIVTPGEAARWDGDELTFAAGPHTRPNLPADASETLWRTYYASTPQYGSHAQRSAKALLAQSSRNEQCRSADARGLAACPKHALEHHGPVTLERAYTAATRGCFPRLAVLHPMPLVAAGHASGPGRRTGACRNHAGRRAAG